MSTEEIRATAERLVKMHRDWGPGMNSPNASMYIKETSHSGPKLRYRIYAQGLPRDAIYSLMQWPVTATSPSVLLPGVTLNESGMAVCAGRPGTCGDPQLPDDPLDTIVSPAPGEPFRFGLVSPGGPKAFVKIVPEPIESTQNGCRVQAVLLLPHAQAVLIEGSGLAPGAKLELLSDYEGELHRGTGSADAAGEYQSAIVPAVPGKQHGTLHVTVKSADCAPSLNVDWGKK